MSLDVWLNAVVKTQVFSANITHNLGKMADEAGIYKALWRPDEVEITQTYSTDLSTYFNEMMLGFIIGTNDLSQFDSYLAQLKALGADEMTQMYQAIYDRTQG